MSVANPIKDLISGGLSGILEGAGNIITKFKADPTKVIEAEADLQKLKIQAEMESEKIAVQLEAEKTKQIEAEQKAVSDRWAADMASDSWLSKNTRPLMLIVLTTFMITIVILDSIKSEFQVRKSYINLLEMLLLAVYGAYYGGRTIEKYHQKKFVK